MRIKGLAAESYGRLKGWTSPELEKGLVVFFGSNEAGKSTLLSMITTIFYGFSPANKSAHPYVPWDGSGIACSAELVLRDGSSITVHRGLRSRPSGQVLSGSSSSSIGNRSIPLLGALPPEIFLEVYALTLDQLRFPQGDVWEVVQNQLLGGQFRSLIKPVSEVLTGIESEANSLWRPDRRGKPRAKQLQRELRRLRDLRRQARDNEEKLRQSQARLVELKECLQQLLDQKTQLTVKLEQIERLKPVYQSLTHIQQLERQAGSVADLDSIPENPLEKLEWFKQQLAKAIQEIETRQLELGELERQQSLFSRTDREVVERRQQIQALTRAYQMIEEDQRVLQDTSLKLNALNERLVDRARLILRGGWQDRYADAVLKIDEAELRANLQALKNTEEDLRKLEARRAGIESRILSLHPSASQLWLSGLLAVGGALSYWLISDSSSLKLLGLALAAGGLGMLLSGLLRFGSSSDGGDLKVLQHKLAQLQHKRQQLLAALEVQLEGIPVALQRLEHPDDSLLIDICTLKELVQDTRLTQEHRSVVIDRLKEKRHQCTTLMQQCGLEESDDLLKDINCLESALEQAQQHRQIAEKVADKLASIEHDLRGLENQRQQMESEFHQLRSQLDQVEGSSLADKAARLAERRRCAQLAGELRQELLRKHPDYFKLEQQLIALEAERGLAELSDEAVASLRVKLEQTQEEISRTNAAISSLETEIRLQMEQQPLSDLEGEIAGLEQELLEIRQQRDRLVLLRELVLTADQRFREEHQPDILKRAERFLALITAGRYTKLFLDEQANRLLVRCEIRNEPLTVQPHTLSRGTLEQIYLALRLALAEHLDPDGEPLPLLLDEALVNWDSSRLQRGLEVLHQVAAERQILLFTCHRWLVKQIEPQAQVVEVL